MSRTGNSAVVLPAVLRELYFGRRTGLLHLQHERDRVTFRFVNGEVVSGSSSAEGGRLGETIVRYGLLSRPDLERALRIVEREGRRLGPVLNELGVIDAPRLERALGLHIREMLLTALRWEEVSHAFEEEELPELSQEDLTLRSSTGELILELVRSITSLETVRQGLGDLDRILVPVTDPPFRLERVTLSPADGYLLSRADGRASARAILAATTLPQEEVERSLLGLLCTGVFEYRSRSGPAGLPDPSATLAPGETVSVPRLPVGEGALTRSVDAAEADLARGRWRSALVALEEVVPMTEGKLERRARLLLARAHGISPGGESEAESELLRLVRLDPDDAEALFALAKLYLARSLERRARPLLQKVLEVQPGHAAAAAALAALRTSKSRSAGLLDRLRHQA